MPEPLKRLEPLDAIAAAFSQHLTAQQCRAGVDRLAAKDAVCADWNACQPS
jgi:hypothetical protein